MREIKDKVKEICELKDKLLRWTMAETEKGRDAIDTDEMGKVVDMIKDLSKVEKNIWEACYYKYIVEAMDEAEEEGPHRMGYDNWRYSSGRFAPKGHGHRTGYIPYVDPMMAAVEFEDMAYNPRMGYTGNVSMDDSKSRYGSHMDKFRDARRHYSETGDKASRQEMDSHAQAHVEEATETIREIWSDASPELKRKMKQDFTKLIGEMDS